MCLEFFAIGKSMVSGVLRNVVYAINVEFRLEIQFSQCKWLQNVMHEFEKFCGLPAVASARHRWHVYPHLKTLRRAQRLFLF